MKKLKLTPPRPSKHTTLTFRVEPQMLEQLETVLAAYRQRYPGESLTRTWLVTELLAHGVEAAARELDAP
jgi:hypothetical protein